MLVVSLICFVNWKGDIFLIDLFCGLGIIVIEVCLIV